MGVLMSAGGVFWSGLSAYYGLWLPGLIPAGYVVLTALNLTRFYLWKNFIGTRFFVFACPEQAVRDVLAHAGSIRFRERLPRVFLRFTRGFGQRNSIRQHRSDR